MAEPAQRPRDGGPARLMRIVTQDRFGGPEVLRVAEVERPYPGPDEVLVGVRAASVNHGEVKVRAGLVPGLGAPPITLGSDLSGVVVETGSKVTRFAVGDEVYGVLFIGTYADFVSVPAANLAPKPPSLDHVHAAALPVAALTALQAVGAAGAREGTRILVHAAAGGVGHLAVQLAKLRGAYVLGTARADKHDFLRGLGVDEPIDYTAVDFTTVARDVDVVIDLVGGSYGRRSLASLRPGGTLLGAVLDPGVTAEEAQEQGRRYAWVGVRPSGPALEEVTRLVEGGQLRVRVQRTYGPAELPDAHRESESGRVTGKLVIEF